MAREKIIPTYTNVLEIKRDTATQWLTKEICQHDVCTLGILIKYYRLMEHFNLIR